MLANDDGEWRETQNLQVGDEIRLANGTWAKVIEVQFKGAGEVYNFTVAGNHNYFVGIKENIKFIYGVNNVFVKGNWETLTKYLYRLE